MYNELCDCLPEKIQKILINYDRIDEIRIRKNRRLCLTQNNKTLVLSYVVSDSDFEYCLSRLCKNSLHTYYESIKKGFIPFDNGYRIGICGNAIVDNGVITNITNINSLNIRIPTVDIEIPDRFLANAKLEKGCLIFSPPNCGKTTLLKATIKHLSSPPYNLRVCVIDPKNELYSERYHSDCAADFLIGYPRHEATDIAMRNMSPDVLICDEIGLNDDIAPLIECKNSGISLICSAHAGSISELLTRPSLKKLHELNTFHSYVQIRIKDRKRSYEYLKREDLHT